MTWNALFREHFAEYPFQKVKGLLSKNNKSAFQKWEKETFLPDDYQGTIRNAEDKYGSYRIMINTFTKEDKELVLCDLFPELKVGDTIIKKKGDKKIYYLRNGKNLTLEYKFCY